VLGLHAQTLIEVAAPIGLQRSRAMRNASGSIRIPLSAGVLRGGG
jgi:4-hydroxyphenylpyruvate dioxygenase